MNLLTNRIQYKHLDDNERALIKTTPYTHLVRLREDDDNNNNNITTMPKPTPYRPDDNSVYRITTDVNGTHYFYADGDIYQRTTSCTDVVWNRINVTTSIDNLDITIHNTVKISITPMTGSEYVEELLLVCSVVRVLSEALVEYLEEYLPNRPLPTETYKDVDITYTERGLPWYIHPTGYVLSAYLHFSKGSSNSTTSREPILFKNNGKQIQSKATKARLVKL